VEREGPVAPDDPPAPVPPVGPVAPVDPVEPVPEPASPAGEAPTPDAREPPLGVVPLEGVATPDAGSGPDATFPPEERVFELPAPSWDPAADVFSADWVNPPRAAASIWL
jgi:hypothetical protein